MKFRIGNKVNLINDNLWRSSKEVGSIVGVDVELDTHYYKVKFATIDCDEEYCLWVDENELETYVKFKAGDKVRVLSDSADYRKNGELGVIAEVEGLYTRNYAKFDTVDKRGSFYNWFTDKELELVNKENN